MISPASTPEVAMEQIILNLGGLHEDQHAAENLILPYLPQYGPGAKCRHAIDLAATLRRGVAIVGPTGSGKTEGTQRAGAWFAETERLKRSRENGYRVRRLLDLSYIRGATYRDTAVTIARRLDPGYVERRGARSKEPNEIRAEIVALCLRQNVAVIVVDEGELCTEESLLLLRDVMSEAERSEAGQRRTADGRSSAGIGVVVVGTPKLKDRLATTVDAGERWAHTIPVEELPTAALPVIYGAWFPGFGRHVEDIGEQAWANYLSSMVARGGSASFRFLDNHARTYFHQMVRSRRANPVREAMPFDREVFRYAVEQAAWAQTAQPAAVTALRGTKGKNGRAAGGVR
jgi:hypothetical protein